VEILRTHIVIEHTDKYWMTHNVMGHFRWKIIFVVVVVMNETKEMFASVHLLYIADVSLPENRTPVCTFLPRPD